MTQFGGGTIAGVIDGTMGQAMPPPIGFGGSMVVPYHRRTLLNGAIGSGAEQTAPNATTPSIIAADGTPAMDNDDVVLTWNAATGQWDDPPVPPPTEGTGDTITSPPPTPNRIQMAVAPPEFNSTLVVGSTVALSDATGTPEAVSALEGLVTTIIPPHVGNFIQLGLIDAGSIDWTGATCTIAKIS